MQLRRKAIQNSKRSEVSQRGWITYQTFERGYAMLVLQRVYFLIFFLLYSMQKEINEPAVFRPNFRLIFPL